MSTVVDTANLQPGFENPVLDAQATFRAALVAFSLPGKRQRFDRLSDVPAPLTTATAAFILMLADLDTPVWLDPGADVQQVQDYLRFHCGCPLMAKPEEADFAIVTDSGTAPRLGEFAQDNELFPDRSATVIFQVSSLDAGQKVKAHGPGIKSEIEIQAKGLPNWFWQDWAVNAACYPLGIDVLLTCGDEAIGLPRSVIVES
ncbi:MAG: phosphonate C-P lyase system protein PhnH [Pseudomonadota bacterium]|nr:phosphonate C-P lyase system protein PhnH [Pseudomonadota bacterium]